MRRRELSDAEWSRFEPLLGTRSGPRLKRGNRDFINAVVWRVRAGVQWPYLPARFGHWKTVYNCFHRCAKPGRWEAIFKALRLDVDELGSLADASVVRAHQDAGGGNWGAKQCSGAFLRRLFNESSRRHNEGR